MRLVDLAHQKLIKHLRLGDHVVDATVGNGVDTCLLAQAVGPTGLVYGFDIQESALEAAKQRLIETNCAEQVRLIHACHSTIKDVAQAPITAAVFNLGYLPKGDHEITTEASTTLSALTSATALLKPGGALSVIVYPGHPAGEQEAEAVRKWVTSLSPAGWMLSHKRPHALLRPAPEWYWIQKLQV